MSSGFVEMLPVLPFAALILAILRNMAGLVTFGVFTPLLFSICLGGDYMVVQFFFICAVFAMGLLVRWVLSSRRLLAVSRMGIIFSVVVLAISLGLEWMHNEYSVIPLETWLFPFVIVVMMIERFIIICEEYESVKKAMGMLGATVLCSVILLPVVHHPWLQSFLRENWYLQIVILAALVWGGEIQWLPAQRMVAISPLFSQ